MALNFCVKVSKRVGKNGRSYWTGETKDGSKYCMFQPKDAPDDYFGEFNILIESPGESVPVDTGQTDEQISKAIKSGALLTKGKKFYQKA